MRVAVGGLEDLVTVCVCACAPVCAYMHKLDRVNAQTISTQPPSVAFIFVYNTVGMASDLCSCYPLFSEFICFSLS